MSPCCSKVDFVRKMCVSEKPENACATRVFSTF